MNTRSDTATAPACATDRSLPKNPRSEARTSTAASAAAVGGAPPPADHESTDFERERIWYMVAILIFIAIATVAVSIADNAVSQLLQEVKQR